MSAKARMSTRQPPVVTVFYIIQATIERSHTLETNIYRTQITWHTNVGSVKTSLYHMLYCSEDTNLFTSSIAQKMSICSYTVLLRRYQPAHTSIVQKIPTYSHLLLFWTCQPAHTLYINLLTSSLSHPVLLIFFYLTAKTPCYLEEAQICTENSWCGHASSLRTSTAKINTKFCSSASTTLTVVIYIHL